MRESRKRVRVFVQPPAKASGFLTSDCQFLEQSNRTHLMRLGSIDAFLIDNRNFDAATPEIGHQPTLLANLNAAYDREMNKSRLFCAGDRFDGNAGLVTRTVNQRRTVSALPDCTRGNCSMQRDVELVDSPGKRRQSFNSGVDGVVRQLAREEDIVPQPNRNALLIKDRELCIVSEFRSKKSDGIGADVGCSHPNRKCVCFSLLLRLVRHAQNSNFRG